MKLTDDERKSIIDALRILEGLKGKLNSLLQRSEYEPVKRIHQIR